MLRVTFENDMFDLVETDPTPDRTAEVELHGPNDFQGNTWEIMVDFMTYGSESREYNIAQIWSELNSAWAFLLASGWERSKITVYYDHSRTPLEWIDDLITGQPVAHYAPDNIYLYRSDGWCWNPSHEYGHAFMASFYPGYELPGIDRGYHDKKYDLYNGHKLNTEYVTGFMPFTEGFAEFVQAATGPPDLFNVDCYYIGASAINWDTGFHYEFYTDLETNELGRGDDGVGNRNAKDGAYVEGAVASILWDIWDDTNDDEPFGGIDQGLFKICYVLEQSQPQDVLEFWDGFVLAFPQDKQKLWNAYYQNGINQDQTPPGPPQNLTVSPSDWSSDIFFRFRWSNPADLSGISKVHFKFLSPPTANSDYDASWWAAGEEHLIAFTDDSYPKGRVTVYAWLSDNAGNADFRSAQSVTLFYDPDPPTSPTITINNGATETESLTVTLNNLTAYEPSGMSGLGDMRFSNDGSAWSAWESYRSSRSSWDLASFGGSSSAGTKKVYVMLRDGAGNTATASDTITYVEPPQAPTAEILSIGPSPASPLFDTVSFREDSRDNDENGQSIVAWQWRSSLGDWQGNSVLSTSAAPDIAARDLQVGSHTITLWVKDDEGDTDTDTASHVVSNVVPVIDALELSPDTAYRGSGASINVSALAHDRDERDQSITGWRVDISGPYDYLGDFTSSTEGLNVHLAVGSLRPGTYSVTIKAKDDEGTWSETRTKQFAVVSLAGDANADCLVNILDLIYIRGRLNQDVSSGDNWTADVNDDGRINILDLIAVRSKLGRNCSQPPRDCGAAALLTDITSDQNSLTIIIGPLGVEDNPKDIVTVIFNDAVKASNFPLGTQAITVSLDPGKNCLQIDGVPPGGSDGSVDVLVVFSSATVGDRVQTISVPPGATAKCTINR